MCFRMNRKHYRHQSVEHKAASWNVKSFYATEYIVGFVSQIEHSWKKEYTNIIVP